MITLKVLNGIYSKIESYCRNKEIIAGKSGRHMKFPYTLSAQIAQFPYFHYMKNNPIWMYYPIGCAMAFYLFTYINSAVNSDGNKRAWAESQRKIAEKEAHH